MSKTHKWTIHEAKGQARWFTHKGPTNMNPKKVKKMGAGKNNWGQPGDELDDLNEDFNFFGRSERRNSNHQLNEANMRILNDKLETDLQG